MLLVFLIKKCLCNYLYFIFYMYVLSFLINLSEL